MFLFDTKRDDEAAEIVPYKKVCVFHSRLYLVETAPREPTNQTTLALGSWACGFLQERAQEQAMSKQNLLGILANRRYMDVLHDQGGA